MALDRDTLDRLFRYSYSLTGSEDEAYTLLQKAIERYLEASRGGATINAVVPYVRQVIRNAFIDDHRRKQRFPEVGLEEVQEGVLDIGVGSLENQMIASVDIDLIWKELNPNEREVLYLWAVEGYSTREIAEQSGTSRNTILSRIHRLRQKLQAWYGKDRTKEGGAA